MRIIDNKQTALNSLSYLSSRLTTHHTAETRCKSRHPHAIRTPSASSSPVFDDYGTAILRPIDRVEIFSLQCGVEQKKQWAYFCSLHCCFCCSSLRTTPLKIFLRSRVRVAFPRQLAQELLMFGQHYTRGHDRLETHTRGGVQEGGTGGGGERQEGGRERMRILSHDGHKAHVANNN